MTTHRYYLIYLRPPRPTSWRMALAVAWGMDIFVGPVPLLKVLLVADVAGHLLF